MKSMMKIFSTRWMSTLLLVILTTACGSEAQNLNKASATSQAAEIPVYTYEIVNAWQHDNAAFTQGLVFQDGFLYESTGQFGQSSLRKVALNTGEVLKKVAVPAKHFAEGMTILNGKVFQLTWTDERGFIYDANSFNKIGEFNFTGEGWGLTNDGQNLILSDGTNQVRFLDPQTFTVTKTLKIFDNGRPLVSLNELEYIKGEIYANIWHSDKIVRIDAESGRILGWIDLSGLLPEAQRQNSEAVLNGIAYDQTGDRLFVTGKLWSKLFEVRLKRK
jgi:glutaminyl-peptide cyclotransferase